MNETVSIERMAYGPEGIAHLKSGKTVFVSGAVTGDVVEIAITQEKANFAKAKAMRIVEPSPLRVANVPCAVCAECGGCPWAALSYPAQLDAKRSHLVEALVRTGGIARDAAENVVAPCVPSKREWGYRNKIELAAFTDAAGRFSLGMHVAGSEGTVAVKSCPLAGRLIEKAPKAVTGALRFLSGREDLGIFRVELRASLRTKSVEIALWTPPGSFPRAQVAHTLQSALKATSIVRVLADPGRARKVRKVEVLDGDGFWRETLNVNTADAMQDAVKDADAVTSQSSPTAVSYVVSAPSFFQVNTAQAEKMVQLALDNLAPLDGKDVADLYSGAGTFSIPIALSGAYVTAIELAGSSSRDARRNIEHASADVDVICDDVSRAFAAIGPVDALVVDPPRAGLAPDVIGLIADALADGRHVKADREHAKTAKDQSRPRLIYVSCDPQTLARDTRRLQERGFVLQSVTPLDVFPQTYHVEAMAMFC